MLINLTNHPFSQWSDEQQQVAIAQFGKCIDLPFPAVDAEGDENYIDSLTDEYLEKVLLLSKENNQTITVHLMGEMTFTYALLAKLKAQNIAAVASTSERKSIDLGSGQKSVEFNFVRFRSYY